MCPSHLTWNSLSGKSRRILFGVQEQGKKFLSRKILVSIEAERHVDYIFSDMHRLFSSVIIWSFKYWTVKCAIVYFVTIIRIAIEVGFVLASTNIIIRLFYVCILHLIMLGLGYNDRILWKPNELIRIRAYISCYTYRFAYSIPVKNNIHLVSWLAEINSIV